MKNLGLTLDCHPTVNEHVTIIARTRHIQLRLLEFIRRFLKNTVSATHVSAFALLKIHYCDSLLLDSTHVVTSRLQRIPNYAVRVILCITNSSIITTRLKQLNWLPVKVRSTYKTDSLCYHFHSSTTPSYVTDMLQRKPSHYPNTRSNSHTMPLLNRPAHSMATLGDRSISFIYFSI